VSVGAILLGWESLRPGGVACLDGDVREGGCVVLGVPEWEMGRRLCDRLLGIEAGGEGRVELLGQDLAGRGERARLELLRQVAHVGVRGDLVSNLRVWENLLLSRAYHQGWGGGEGDLGEAERELMDALREVGEGETWMLARAGSAVQELGETERRLCGLLRAHLARPRLLVCEHLFDDIAPGAAVRLARLVQWMRGRHEGMGLLVIHRPLAGSRPAAWLAELSSGIVAAMGEIGIGQGVEGGKE
jgi:ABC-type multidrug transport system ATPase subunit